MNAAARTSLILAGIALALGAVALARESNPRIPGTDTGYAPEQPIAFSHRLHAGELEISCLHCHTAAEKSRHAGIPPVQTCMNCHKFVAATSNDVRIEEERAKAEQRPPRPVVSREIAKIYRAMGLDSGGHRDSAIEPESIRWVRVHNLPDFVSFDHSRHVNAGAPGSGVACRRCHGPVETMERIRQTADLTMGMCVNCHREANAEYHANGGRLDRASVDCSACHQ